MTQHGQSVHLTEADIERRTAVIVANALRAAEAEKGTDWIISNDESIMWIKAEKKSAAIRQYIAETEPYRRVNEVACRREWLRVDTDLIEEAARDYAEDDFRSDEDCAAYTPFTWEGEGFAWTTCKRNDDGAEPFWRCEWKA